MATENRFFGEFCEIWPDNADSASPRITLDRYVTCQLAHINYGALDLGREAFHEEMIRHLLDSVIRFQLERSEKICMVDKITPYLGTSGTVLAAIEKFFPTSEIVLLIRDGRDVLTSGVFDWMKRKDRGTDRYARFVEGRREIKLQRFFTDEDIETWSRYWTEPLDAIGQARPSSLTIRYETMLERQDLELERLLAHIECETSPMVLRQCVAAATFEKMSGGRSRGQVEQTAKTRSGTAGDWRTYFTRRDGELFLGRVGRRLYDLGYEQDDSWLHELPTQLS